MLAPAPLGSRLGAHAGPDGVTFRVWAPGAQAVHVATLAPGETSLADWAPYPSNLLVPDDQGFWSGFLPGAKDGWQYRFWTRGPGGAGYKRDPRASELSFE